MILSNVHRNKKVLANNIQGCFNPSVLTSTISLLTLLNITPKLCEIGIKHFKEFREQCIGILFSFQIIGGANVAISTYESINRSCDSLV